MKTAIEQWHYDPAADVDPALLGRICSHVERPGALIFAVRAVALVIVRCWLRLYHRFNIVGRENLPREGSAVLIANHASHLDTLCLLAALPLDRLRRAFPAAAKDYFCSNNLRARLASLFVNSLPFDRKFSPWESLSASARLLGEPGTILILFPEGTRSGNGVLGSFKPGVGLLAAASGVPVVPCYLDGTHAALPKGGWFPRPATLRLIIGSPRWYGDRPTTKEGAREITHELRQAVIALTAFRRHVGRPSQAAHPAGRPKKAVPQAKAEGL